MRFQRPLVDLTLIPLRLFLGVTFVFAGLQKLADPAYLRASAPSSVQAQLAAAQRTSPISGSLGGVAHHAVVFGLLIAVGELAVGLGTLLGLWTRVAAAGGMALALGFLLTVSWHTSPYYLGADIVFLMAFTPILIAGPHPWSLDALVDRRSRAESGLATVTPVTIDFDRVRRICGQHAAGDRCVARPDGRCEPAGCPVLDDAGRRAVEQSVDLSRRRFLATARMAGGLALLGVGVGAATALAGRIMDTGGHSGGGGTAHALSSGSGADPGGPTTTTAPAPGPSSSVPSSAPPGRPIGSANAVPPGSAATFTDPGSADPAVVIHRSDGTFVAFDTVCPHQGCTVELDPSADELHCPCHGARFDAKTGAVLQGPAQTGLRAVAVSVGPDNRLYAV